MIISLLAISCISTNLSLSSPETDLFIGRPGVTFDFTYRPNHYENLSVVVLRASEESVRSKEFHVINASCPMNRVTRGVQNVEILSSYPVVPHGSYEILDFPKIPKGQLYFGIVNTSKDNRVELLGGLNLATDTRTIAAHLLMAVDSTEFVKDEHPQYSVLYTYVNKVLEGSFEEAERILDYTTPPYPYKDTLSRGSSIAQLNKLEGPSLRVFNRAKSALPVKKLMILAELYSWGIRGLDEEFVTTFLGVKDDPRVEQYVRLSAVHFDFNSSGGSEEHHREFVKYVELAESTSLVDGKRVFLDAIRFKGMFTSQSERTRVAKMLMFNSEKLNVDVINWLAFVEDQPDNRIDRKLSGPERTAQIAALRTFWLTFYNLPPG